METGNLNDNIAYCKYANGSFFSIILFNQDMIRNDKMHLHLLYHTNPVILFKFFYKK